MWRSIGKIGQGDGVGGIRQLDCEGESERQLDPHSTNFLMFSLWNKGLSRICPKISALHFLRVLNFSFEFNVFERIMLDSKRIIDFLLVSIRNSGVSDVNTMIIVCVKRGNNPVV
jgi:hypothetical protein